jgi:hypothetical protein
MAIRAERRMVLEMVQEKRITAGEGAKLIEALQGFAASKDRAAPEPEIGRAGIDRPRWVRVRVTDAANGSPRVNLRLPVGLVERGIKAGARLAPEVGGIELERLLGAIEAGQAGRVIDEVDGDGSKHIEITLE